MSVVPNPHSWSPEQILDLIILHMVMNAVNINFTSAPGILQNDLAKSKANGTSAGWDIPIALPNIHVSEAKLCQLWRRDFSIHVQ